MFLDVRATLDGRRTLVELVRRVADRLSIPFTVGGGVRAVADAEQLLGAGADKVAVNTAALARPELVTELARELGSQAVVIAIDAERGRVRSRAGTAQTGRDAVGWAREAQERGAGEILLTSIDADGTRGRLRPGADCGGGGHGRHPGDRIGRRRHRPTRRRRSPRRAGRAACLDPA